MLRTQTKQLSKLLNSGSIWQTDQLNLQNVLVQYFRTFHANSALVNMFFPEIISNNLMLLQDFIKFIDENRILRSIRKDNLLYRTIKLDDFKQLHPKLQQECIKQIYVDDFVQEILEGAQIIILCEKNPPIENILVLLIKPQIFDEIRDKDKLFILPELKIYYTILSISSYPYSEIN